MTIQVKATEQYFSACNAVYYAVQNGSREPYQTVSTVYFILGILRTDLWSQRTIMITKRLPADTLILALFQEYDEGKYSPR